MDSLALALIPLVIVIALRARSTLWHYPTAPHLLNECCSHPNDFMSYGDRVSRSYLVVVWDWRETFIIPAEHGDRIPDCSAALDLLSPAKL